MMAFKWKFTVCMCAKVAGSYCVNGKYCLATSCEVLSSSLSVSQSASFFGDDASTFDTDMSSTKFLC